jgi:hypothetical protein
MKMGKQAVVKAGLTNVWLYRNGVFQGGATATLTEAEWTALGASGQALLGTPSTVADPVRPVNNSGYTISKRLDLLENP